MSQIRPIETLLIANRGEIARRIQRTCRARGVRTVAVFSEADRDAPFVREADLALCLGAAPASESYLNIDKLLDACRRANADAVHPGYGFLAENAVFAKAVTDAGLLFVGPRAEAIAAMGSKQGAKALAEEAGVPVLTGYHGNDQSDERFLAEGERIGFPLLLKASAGGGGKGMRVVRSVEELREGLAVTRREAAGAFGDPTLLLERFVERPRHIEVQILGDHHGNLIHLYERECSIQRRHQKIIEEAPAPNLRPETREAIHAAALRLGRAIGYTSAGTVEMLVDADEGFYFLEVNTRLQVEHPVTEEVTGLDLVEEQLRIAEGYPMRFPTSPPPLRGVAIECRVYAEDPARDYLPGSGHLRLWETLSGPGLRVDDGVQAPCDVSIHYDPMLAKVIASGEDRAHALRRMRRALDGLVVAGVPTNRDQLRALFHHPAFCAGNLHTGFLTEHADTLSETIPLRAADEAMAIAVVAMEQERWSKRTHLPSLRPGFRNHPDRAPQAQLLHRGTRHSLAWSVDRDGWWCVQGAPTDERREVRVIAWDAPALRWEQRDGSRHQARVYLGEHDVDVHLDGALYSFHLPARLAGPEAETEKGSCLAPMPGKIVTLEVAVGDRVEEGAVLLRLEAMKMEHALRAPRAGVVREVLTQPGDQVEADQPLVLLVDEDAPEG